MKMRGSSILILCFFGISIIGIAFLSSSGTAFAHVEVDIKPDTLNVMMQSKWITVYIEPPEGYNVSDIDHDPSKIMFEGLFQAEWSNVEGEVLMVKFDASSVTSYLWGQLYHMGVNRALIELKVTGQLKDGTPFSGVDTIIVIHPKGF